MTERVLGKSGLKVSAIGLGCMGMSEFYDPRQQNDDESVLVIHRFLDAGGTFLDAADMYGVGRNEPSAWDEGAPKPSPSKPCAQQFFPLPIFQK